MIGYMMTRDFDAPGIGSLNETLMLARARCGEIAKMQSAFVKWGWNHDEPTEVCS